MNTRRYKITAWIDVPISSNSQYKTEDDIQRLVEDKLSEEDIYGMFEVEKMELPDQLLDDFDDSVYEGITSFNEPVGFIAPDGKFYGMESEDDGLAHIALAHEIYEYYKDIYPVEHSEYGIDYSLELMGFIKIHGGDLHYYQEIGNIKYWTPEQCNTVLRWMKNREEIEHNEQFHGRCCVFSGFNGNTYLYSYEFAKMDKFAIMKCFVDI